MKTIYTKGGIRELLRREYLRGRIDERASIEEGRSVKELFKLYDIYLKSNPDAEKEFDRFNQY